MLTKFKLYESKRSDKLLEKFLELYERYKQNAYLTKNLPDLFMPEVNILSFLYMHHTDFQYWGDKFEKEDRNLTKKVVKKYVEVSIKEKMKDMRSYDYDNLMELDPIKYWKDYQHQAKMCYYVLGNLFRKHVPKRIVIKKKFNL